jgi:hypothetical protein
MTRSERLGQALVLGLLTAATSYVGQRLLSRLLGELPPEAIFSQVHVPYFWRVGTAGWHGAVVTLVAGLALRRLHLGPIGALTPPLASALAAACVLVP